MKGFQDQMTQQKLKDVTKNQTYVFLQCKQLIACIILGYHIVSVNSYLSRC